MDETPLQIVRSLESMVDRVEVAGLRTRALALALSEALQRVDLLDLEALTWTGRGYIKEKLYYLRRHLKAAAGKGQRNGHSRSTHASWARACLDALGTSLTFGRDSPRSMSRFED